MYTGGQNPSIWVRPTETLGQASSLERALYVFQTMG